MEVFLYNSTVCRLCGEENDSGNLLYSCEENNQSLCDLINTYLPIKVSDDGILPRTICPGCTIQLEATIEFLNLIINGQKVIRQLHQREKEYKKTILSNEPEVIENIVCEEINTSDGVFQVEHPIALQVSGLERPRRKRGRPPKKPKSAEELAREVAAREQQAAHRSAAIEEEVTGKRRRKTPTRFKEAVQGKELERIFKEEGVIDETESEVEVKPDTTAEPPPERAEPEVIGHMETSGELVVVVKGKGRGRPKGRMRQTREECSICGMEFSSVGRYMSHVAQHGPVQYQCSCGHTAATLIQHQTHQTETQHTGQVVIPRKGERENEQADVDVEEIQEADPLAVPEREESASDPDKSLPLSDQDSAHKPHTPEATATSNTIATETPETEDKEPEVVELGPKGKPKLKCSHCDKTFNSKQSRSMHIKAVHLCEKPYVCSECGCAFAYPRSLALHAISHRRHRAARRYACDLCGKVLNHPSSVVYHKEAEHANQRYVCNKCGKWFKHKQLLQRHQLVHSQLRPYCCKACNASFKTKANLLNHQLLHSGVKKFSCDICKHKFAHKTSLTLHMRWHTGSKPFCCKICGKSFSQKGNLSEHERIHSGEKPYQCTLCPRKFTTSSQYRMHARRHQPDRPYACSHCPKRFASRTSWSAHQRREAGVRAHACGVCGRAFAERWALLKHMRSHTGERPFRCPHCPRTFADCSNLNKHKKQVHKQISLLVNNDGNAPEQQIVVQREELRGAGAGGAGEAGDGVIYVTYDVDDDQSGYTIMDTEQASGLLGGVLVSGGALQTLSPVLIDTEEELSLNDTDTISVTDEAGNPLHFTMQDGTRLAVTSADGHSLQVITQDGQTIPVEINGYHEEEEVEEGHEPSPHKARAASPAAHYYTIA